MLRTTYIFPEAKTMGKLWGERKEVRRQELTKLYNLGVNANGYDNGVTLAAYPPIH